MFDFETNVPDTALFVLYNSCAAHSVRAGLVLCRLGITARGALGCACAACWLTAKFLCVEGRRGELGKRSGRVYLWTCVASTRQGLAQCLAGYGLGLALEVTVS